MAKVQLTEEAREDVRDLDGAARKLVLKGLKRLEDEPEKRGDALGSHNTGNPTGLLKLVIGNRDYRIVYKVEGDGNVVVVWVVDKRVDAECYEVALTRIKLYAEPGKAQQLENLIASVWTATEPAHTKPSAQQ